MGQQKMARTFRVWFGHRVIPVLLRARIGCPWGRRKREKEKLMGFCSFRQKVAPDRFLSDFTLDTFICCHSLTSFYERALDTSAARSLFSSFRKSSEKVLKKLHFREKC